MQRPALFNIYGPKYLGLLTVVILSPGFYLNSIQIVRLCFDHMTIYQLEVHKCEGNCLRELVFKSHILQQAKGQLFDFMFYC